MQPKAPPSPCAFTVVPMPGTRLNNHHAYLRRLFDSGSKGSHQTLIWAGDHIPDKLAVTFPITFQHASSVTNTTKTSVKSAYPGYSSMVATDDSYKPDYWKINLKKRKFIFAALSAATVPAFAKKRTEDIKETGPTLLTISGAIGKGNRGALDPALDQMMHKQNIQFDKAYVYNFSALTSLPFVEITPTLEYDAKAHTLRGPLLIDVIAAAANIVLPGNTAVKLRAVDGYVVQVALAELRKYRFIVATHLDGQPIPLGGLGPLWAVYDPDRFPDIMSRPLSARFALCPWALYHIELRAA